MTAQAEESIEEKVARMEKTLGRVDHLVDSLQPLADIVSSVSQEPEGLNAEASSYRARYWSEHEGNKMGAEMTSFYQKKSPKFAESVSRTVATYANSEHGMLNADAMINGHKYNWVKTLILIGLPFGFLYLIFSNPANADAFGKWAGAGVNAYILIVAVLLALLLIGIIVNRRRPTPVS